MFYVSAGRVGTGRQLFVQKDGSWIIPVMNAWDIAFLREEAKRLVVAKA